MALFIVLYSELQKYTIKKFIKNWSYYKNNSDMVIGTYYQYLRIQIVNFMLIPILTWANIFGIKPAKIIFT